jgi:hypothetical protein
MLRVVGAVVLGYFVMALGLFLALSLAYFVLGADGAFRPGVYDVSAAWVVTSFVAGVGAALAGGWVARRVAGNVNGPRALAGVVVALGILFLIPVITGGQPVADARIGAPGMFEAMQQAQTPLWIMLLNPLIGAAGVLIGGRALRGEPAAAPGHVAVG